MSNFSITRGKGFHLTFENGLCISVQFGAGNYCTNYYNDMMEEIRQVERGICAKSNTAEVAIWDTLDNDKWLTKKFVKGEDVAGYLSSDEVGKLIAKVQRWKRK